MDTLSLPGTCVFDRFCFDDGRCVLFRRSDDGQLVKINLGSRALAVLGVLVGRSDELVSKDEIMGAVWPGTAVEDANLTVQISSLRRILDAGRPDGSCIQTVPGRGYRFVARVARVPAEQPEPPTADEPAGRPASRSLHGIASVAVGVVLLAASLGAIDWMSHRHTAPATSAAAALNQGRDRRQSAIILPFENSSSEPAQDDLAAALTRDLTGRIALAGDGPVVPAITASAYRGKSVDLQTIGSQYDVHFALVGDVRRQPGRVIVRANVYDIAEGQPIWSRQFDLPDNPGSLTRIVQNIYESYWQSSLDVEAYRAMHDHPARLDERDLMLVALATRLSTPTKDHYLEKMSLVDRALAIDPNNFQGLERQARLHAESVLLGYSSDPPADLAIAQKASDRLLAIDPNHLLTLRARTSLLRARGDWVGAEAVVRRVIALQPTEALRHYDLGSILMAEGRHQEALQSFENAKSFAGGSDPVYLFDANIAMAKLAIGQFREAIAVARASIPEFPPDTGRLAELPWLALIAAASDSGQDGEARADLQRFRATPRSEQSMSQIQRWPAVAANQNLLNGLRNAGMPAEATAVAGEAGAESAARTPPTRHLHERP
jgi:DNA-binding winged helix-turn-helix (wHTH) protein/TolB-like protein/tetratricopeptide (TPR) repeat protein